MYYHFLSRNNVVITSITYLIMDFNLNIIRRGVIKKNASKAIFMDDARKASGFTTGNATCSHADFSHALTQISALGVGRKSDHLNPIYA